MIREPAFTDIDSAAMQALMNGVASADQQKRALQWILTNACAIWDDHPEVEHEWEIVHYDGRRYVGIQINKLCRPTSMTVEKGGANTSIRKRPRR